MTVYISELLKGIAKARTRKEKKALLEKYKTNNILRFVLQGTFDPSISVSYTHLTLPTILLV